jgi:hypothetical protein
MGANAGGGGEKSPLGLTLPRAPSHSDMIAMAELIQNPSQLSILTRHYYHLSYLSF